LEGRAVTATLDVRESDGDCLLPVRVTPRASKTEILGVAEGRLRVRLQAPPVDGAANAALSEFLAKFLRLPKSAVTVARGETGREKTLRVAGMSAKLLTEKLMEKLGELPA
jgi:uncharacterized protein (TIGR00251 family)